MKNICILGSTGSIGINTLDVIRQHPDKFKAHTLVANTNTALLSKQIKSFQPYNIVIYDKDAYHRFVKEYSGAGLNILSGADGLNGILEADKPDIFVNAFVGFAGLKPTVKAIQSGIHIALANKETLVVAGAYVTGLARKHQVNILPIDSEHSAIWQCLRGEDGNPVKRLILTASGGPFRTYSEDKLKHVTPLQALDHPNWKMGPKITIDSATLMNKGLEVIEAYWLYDLPIESIEVIIHPQSIIHSMVEFEDKSIKAQLGIPDMRIPIQYALSYPQRLKLDIPAMNFKKSGALTFEEPDFKKFPCLQIAFEALKSGDTYPAVLNAANEIAVKAFLNKQIGFMDIPVLIKEQLDRHQPLKISDLAAYMEIDLETRKLTEKAVNIRRRL
jgi:1-deoxy-D-xylulose-5-phosphate reductoisomerase